MKNPQPNFESVKREFYSHYMRTNCPSTRVDMLLLSDTIHTVMEGKVPKSHYNRKVEFGKELNEWLDRMDIRHAGLLIDTMIKDGANMLPAWMKKKQYTIEYNQYDALDLIIKH